MFFSRVTPSGVCDPHPPAVRSSSASERTWITVPWWRLRCLHTNPPLPGLRTARGGWSSACFSGTELWGKPAWLSATQPMDIQLNTSRQRLTISQVRLWMRNCAILVIFCVNSPQVQTGVSAEEPQMHFITLIMNKFWRLLYSFNSPNKRFTWQACSFN